MMATVLRPTAPCILAKTKARSSAGAGPAALAAAGFRHAREILACLIDVSLALVVLLSDVVLAASLGFMIAGQLAG